jgi:arylsulfatase A-like enzyme
VARWPGKVRPGSTCDTTVCLNDLLATAAAISGATLPATAGEDSASLLPALTRESASSSRAVVHQSMQGDLAIRQGPWKLIFHKGGQRELFNLSEDLGEMQDVLAAKPEVAKKLATLMQTYIDQGRSTPGEAQTNEATVSLDGKAATGKSIR